MNLIFVTFLWWDSTVYKTDHTYCHWDLLQDSLSAFDF